jgi:DNA-binding NarL/FixJ family response regulator
VRVVLGEDLTLLRDGLIRLLTAYDMDVVAAVDNGPELLRALVEHRPDVAVVDVRLPPSFTDEGLRAAIAARAQVPGLPVLVLSQHVEPLYARELLSSARGGLGYLLKDRVSDVRRFIEAVRTVAAGGTAMDPEVVSQLLARHARDETLSRLTRREREVLALRGAPTPGSPPGWWSRRKRSTSTSAASSPSWTCIPLTTATAAC